MVAASFNIYNTSRSNWPRTHIAHQSFAFKARLHREANFFELPTFCAAHNGPRSFHNFNYKLIENANKLNAINQCECIDEYNSCSPPSPESERSGWCKQAWKAKAQSTYSCSTISECSFHHRLITRLTTPRSHSICGKFSTVGASALLWE